MTIKGMVAVLVTEEGKEVKGQAGPGVTTLMIGDGKENRSRVDKAKNQTGGI